MSEKYESRVSLIGLQLETYVRNVNASRYASSRQNMSKEAKITKGQIRTYPELANASTSKDVKSGATNLSFSKSLLQGSFGTMVGALSTSFPNALVLSLFTIAAIENQRHQ